MFAFEEVAREMIATCEVGVGVGGLFCLRAVEILTEKTQFECSCKRTCRCECESSCEWCDAVWEWDVNMSVGVDVREMCEGGVNVSEV